MNSGILALLLLGGIFVMVSICAYAMLGVSRAIDALIDLQQSQSMPAPFTPALNAAARNAEKSEPLSARSILALRHHTIRRDKGEDERNQLRDAERRGLTAEVVDDDYPEAAEVLLPAALRVGGGPSHIW